MVDLADKAKGVLLSAKWSDTWDLYVIKRTLGYKTWATGGERGARRDIADLYKAGLIRELLSPWHGEVYLTEKGVRRFKEMSGENNG